MKAGRVRQSVVGVAVAVALAAGCSSDDGTIALPTTDSTTTSSQPPRTTEAPTTTEAPAETPATKPDLEIPTEWDSDLDEIFGRYLLFWEAEAHCVGSARSRSGFPAPP